MRMKCRTWYEDYLGDCCNNDCEHCYGDKENIFAKDDFEITDKNLNPIKIYKGERFWIHSETKDNVIVMDDSCLDHCYTFRKDFFNKHFSYNEINTEEEIMAGVETNIHYEIAEPFCSYGAYETFEEARTFFNNFGNAQAIYKVTETRELVYEKENWQINKDRVLHELHNYLNERDSYNLSTEALEYIIKCIEKEKEK